MFHFYQKLIQLRHTHEIIVYGSYDLLLPDDPQLYLYTRTLGSQKLLCACFTLPEAFDGAQTLISVGQAPQGRQVALGPWDGFALLQTQPNET